MPLTLNSPLHVLEDSGVPVGSTDYTTAVILHGLVWHSGIFTKLVPLAHHHNARVILVNRRDYVGSTPYTEEERALLPVLSPEEWEDAGKVSAAKEEMKTFMRGRAREVYDFLGELVNSGEVPVADREKSIGGIVVAGWSLAGTWMTALLAHVASFPVGDVNLSNYMRRVVFFDSPLQHLGLPPPERAFYSPMFDPDIAPEDRQQAFMNWVSGYYPHGGTPETMEPKTFLQDPPPTISTLTVAEIARMTTLPPGAPGGSDGILARSGVRLGLFADLRERALYLPDDKVAGDVWQDVEVRCVVCEQSVSSALWTAILLRKEVEEAKAKGLPIRNVRFVRIRRANHFVQWDQPEHALRALIEDEDVVV